ncbi:MAG: hypothetical protein ACEY3B_03350, partial [Wolbachia sp.]
AAIILCNPPINTLSFLLNFVIEPAGQEQVLSHKYPYYHNKGAGGACQASFLFLLNDSCDLGGSAKSLFPQKCFNLS